MGILDKFTEHTGGVLLCTREFIKLTEEYDKLQAIADVKFEEIMQYVSEHPKEFGMITNLGDSNVQREEKVNN